MPADRSSKGKGKQKEEVEPCEICGAIVSRKSDLKRHAKRHTSDDDKLPCTVEDCEYKTWQQSNLDTHIRRHAKERIHICTDDPECKFDSCDPAALLRHRKRFHGYIPGPRTPAKPKVVPVRVLRGVEANSPGSSNAVASQFFAFSFANALASTSGSSWSRPMSPPPSPSPSPSPPFSCSPLPSLSPSPSLHPVASGSRLPPPPSRQTSGLRVRSYSPTYSSGENEGSSFTPLTSPPSQHESTQAEGFSPTVLSMIPSVHAGSMMMNPHHTGSLLFAPANDFYIWPGVNPILPLTSSSALSDGSSSTSFSSETGTWDDLGHDQHLPMEVYDTPREDVPPISFDELKLWPGPQSKGKAPESDSWP